MKNNIIVSLATLLTILTPFSASARHGFGHRQLGCSAVRSGRNYTEWRSQLSSYNISIARSIHRNVRGKRCYIVRLKTNTGREFLAIDRDNIRWATDSEFEYFRSRRRLNQVVRRRGFAFTEYKRGKLRLPKRIRREIRPLPRFYDRF